VARELLEKNIQIDVIFGMTESAGDGSWCLVDENHLGTIGKPDGNIAFRIVDGEILLKSDGVMKGYYKDSDETAKVIVDGWLHTGDMGYCDEDGYYYITGRKKNVIILSNGENVNPEEIEATFGACAAIEECLVYSDGKGICGDVYTSDRDSAAAFIKAYNESMPMYRQVYKITYTDEPLPKTGSGKIKRKENK
jgi:long-chain acyl-CoA synthetase